MLSNQLQTAHLEALTCERCARMCRCFPMGGDLFMLGELSPCVSSQMTAIAEHTAPCIMQEHTLPHAMTPLNVQ